jgi:hypothetical protein
MLIFTVGASSPLPAQTTRPDPQWDRVITSIATASSRDVIAPLLSPQCIIHKFGDGRDEDVESLLEFVAGRLVLGHHTYICPPQTMAADIVADINGSSRVSDDVKASMTPDGPAARRTAADVAMRWVNTTLGADDGTPVGIVVLWNASDEQSDQHRATFILIRGEQVGDRFQINRIFFGDPLQ